MLSLVVAAGLDGFNYHTLGRIFPFTVGILGLIFVLPLLYKQQPQPNRAELADRETNSDTEHSEWFYLGSIVGMLAFFGVVVIRSVWLFSSGTWLLNG